MDNYMLKVNNIINSQITFSTNYVYCMTTLSNISIQVQVQVLLCNIIELFICAFEMSGNFISLAS